jgi:hypothetical protein
VSDPLVDEDQVLMIRRAVFGEQVQQFISSQIGQYLLARAQEDKVNAQAKFLEVDPSNVEAVRSIQNDILMSNKFAIWLQDAVGDGLRALGIIEDRS